MVVVQHSAKTLASLDLARIPKKADVWVDKSIGQALVIALRVVVRDEVVNRRPQ